MAMENYSLSDIAAVNGGAGGFGGSSPWVLIILFALIFGWGGNGFGNRSDFSQYATAASQQEILFGQQFQGLDNKIDRIGNGIADATFALNNSVTGEGRALQMQIAECCCGNKEATAQVRYDMANFAAATQTAIHAEGEQTRALLQQNKIEALQSQVTQLQMAQAMAGVVRYPNGMTYNAGTSPFCNCGCNGTAF